MKTARKVLLLVLCAALLVSATVMGTLAYLTSDDEVVNTFTVGDVEIILDEAPVDENGQEEEGDRVKANEYHLLPGGSYDKDPMVTVIGGSEAAYIRMLVTVTKLDALIENFPDDVAEDGTFLLQNWVAGWDASKWEFIGVADGVYEFRYIETVEKSADNQELEPLFTQVIVPEDATNEQMAASDGIEINVVAQAIQAAGFDSADEAWAEWE